VLGSVKSVGRFVMLGRGSEARSEDWMILRVKESCKLEETKLIYE
jgi:hypothetical protein